VAERLAPATVSSNLQRLEGEPLASQLLDKYVYSNPDHRWLKEGMNKEQLQKIQEFYRQRYGEQNEPK
jgi:hypothetical protein